MLLVESTFHYSLLSPKLWELSRANTERRENRVTNHYVREEMLPLDTSDH